jgi:hypothetical protein
LAIHTLRGVAAVNGWRAIEPGNRPRLYPFRTDLHNVHHDLLFGGMYILENLDLSQLARDRVDEFLYMTLATSSCCDPCVEEQRPSSMVTCTTSVTLMAGHTPHYWRPPARVGWEKVAGEVFNALPPLAS